MDIEKEREAFEIQFRNTKQYISILHFIEMGAAGSHQDIHSVFQRCDFNEDEYAHSSVQSGWLMWQAAKAKAIPDGYVLMLKEPNREFKDRLRSYLNNLWMGDHGCDWDYFVDATAIKPNEIWRFMIEAQEPAND